MDFSTDQILRKSLNSRTYYNDKAESEPPNVSKIQGHEKACSSGVIDTSSNMIEGPVLTRSSSSSENYQPESQFSNLHVTENQFSLA